MSFGNNTSSITYGNLTAAGTFGNLTTEIFQRPLIVDFLIIGGGGRGGNSEEISNTAYGMGGGGGAGGYRSSWNNEPSGDNHPAENPITDFVLGTDYPVAVGNGASAGQSGSINLNAMFEGADDLSAENKCLIHNSFSVSDYWNYDWDQYCSDD